LVSYERKHNEANGEENRDGCDHNLSCNFGVEGPTDDPEVDSLRNRQVKNFLALNLFALGAPMLLMGDEVRRTQKGNNNAYCQDNEISWFDWELPTRHPDVHRFVRLLIDARLKRDSVKELSMTLNQLLAGARFEWHGVRLGHPDWGSDSHSIALTSWSMSGRVVIHLMVNAWREPLGFELPPTSELPGGRWHRWLDTSLASPADIVPLDDVPAVESGTYQLPPHALAVVIARVPAGAD